LQSYVRAILRVQGSEYNRHEKQGSEGNKARASIHIHWNLPIKF
jgi:hypothetical protein